MRGVREFIFMARDLARYLAGRDYFRQAQPLGMHFRDSRCYYNDLRGKAAWTGKTIAGIPARQDARSGQFTIDPLMVLLFGVGSLDRYFIDKDDSGLRNARNAVAWMLDNVLPGGFFDNKSVETYPAFEHYSNNSAMTQGLALSFGVRMLRFVELEDRKKRAVERMLSDVAGNMLLDSSEGGTVLRDGGDVFFQEFCRKDGHIVLNGWIFAVFGLIDYTAVSDDAAVAGALSDTIATMTRKLPSYHRPDGWSVYDNMGRICSPFYHRLHQALLDAMWRLTGVAAFGDFLELERGSDTPVNRAYYTGSKIYTKFFRDTEKYGSQG